jgi:hypothetical protein
MMMAGEMRIRETWPRDLLLSAEEGVALLVRRTKENVVKTVVKKVRAVL